MEERILAQTHTHTHMQARTCIHTHTHTSVHAHTHTHTHTCLAKIATRHSSKSTALTNYHVLYISVWVATAKPTTTYDSPLTLTLHSLTRYFTTSRFP